MKKMRIALASMLVAAGITATAGAANFTNCADRLKDVGLFQGTNQGYQLDKAPTRAEASAMLVRLLGKEEEAGPDLHRAVHRPCRLGEALCAVSVRQRPRQRHERDCL